MGQSLESSEEKRKIFEMGRIKRSCFGRQCVALSCLIQGTMNREMGTIGINHQGGLRSRTMG